MAQSYAQKQLVHLLGSGGAHASFDDIVSGFSPKLRGLRPAGAPHTAWQLMEHLRLAQWDIIEYTISTKHVSPEFPSGYWPATPAPPNARAWDASVASFKKDLARMLRMVKDSPDVFAPLPGGKEHTMFSRALLLADHNSYHYGQLMFVRRLLEQ